MTSNGVSLRSCRGSTRSPIRPRYPKPAVERSRFDVFLSFGFSVGGLTWQISATSHFTNDLGLDSLDTVEVVMAIEEEFSIEIPDKDADEIRTVGDAIEYIFDLPEYNPHARLLFTLLSFGMFVLTVTVLAESRFCCGVFAGASCGGVCRLNHTLSSIFSKSFSHKFHHTSLATRHPRTISKQSQMPLIHPPYMRADH